MSAEQAGKLIGVSGTQWFRMETGARAVALSKVLKIERLTGLPRAKLRPDVYADEVSAA